jgi:hypothetical protein
MELRGNDLPCEEWLFCSLSFLLRAEGFRNEKNRTHTIDDTILESFTANTHTQAKIRISSVG